MNTFQEILPQVMGKLGLARRYKSETVLFQWREIVGKKIADQTQAVNLQRGILSVVANSSVWAHHLMTSKEDIITKINNFCNEKVVSDIKFKAGYLKNDQNEENTDIESFPPNWKRAILTAEDLADMEDIALSISDKRLQQKAKQLLTKEKASKKAKLNCSWHGCECCGVLCPPTDNLCQICSIERKNGQKYKLYHLLTQAPWLDYNDAVQYVECHWTEFNTIKDDIIDRINKEIIHGSTDKLKITTLAMLIHQIKPQAINDEIIKQTLDKVRGKKNVSTFRS